METYDSLEGLYSHIEQNAAEVPYASQIGDLFRAFRDLAHKANNLTDANIAQWEIDFWHFVLEDGKIKPSFSGTDNEGNLIEYPSLARFDNNIYDYLIKRLECSKNPAIIVRYAQILWNSPKKHTKYAKLAIDAYLELIPIYEALDNSNPNDYAGLDLIHSIKNVYYISKQVNYKIQNVKSELKRLIHSFNQTSSSSFALRINLIELMLQGKFQKDDFQAIPTICWNLSHGLVSSGNTHGAIRILEIGEKVEIRLESETHEWRKEIALLYEKLMEKAENDNNPSCINFVQSAIENYKKVNENEKIKELEVKYDKLKTSFKLEEFKTEIDLTNHIKRCKEIAEKVVANPPEEIIKILMFDKNLLPKYKDLEIIAEKNAKEFIVQHLIPIEIFDQSGNTAQHFSDEEEKKYFGILQQYNIELKVNKSQLINEIFLAAVQCKKLTTESMLSYFETNSWFGRTIQRKAPNARVETYNWLNMLAPNVHEFFYQFNYALLNPNYQPNLVLCIDSLTLKLEGLFRDICRFSGVTTFYMTKDSKGRTISREKDIHGLLYEDKIRELIDEDDLLFLKYLLVEKVGLNLRHKVAHALMIYEEYGLTQMYLLLLALLRLGKYNFVK